MIAIAGNEVGKHKERRADPEGLTQQERAKRNKARQEGVDKVNAHDEAEASKRIEKSRQTEADFQARKRENERRWREEADTARKKARDAERKRAEEERQKAEAQAAAAGKPKPPAEPQKLPGRPKTAAEAATAFRRALDGGGDLHAAALDLIKLMGNWKTDMRVVVESLSPAHKATAEAALVKVRDQIVKAAWDKVTEGGKKYGDLEPYNVGTKAFDSDIDITIKPKEGAAGEVGELIGRADEASKALKEALREQIGGQETDLAIDTNVYSFIGEGVLVPKTEAERTARADFDRVTGFAELIRGGGEARLNDLVNQVKKGMGGDRAAIDHLKDLAKRAKEFVAERNQEHADALKEVRKKHGKTPEATEKRLVRDKILADKKQKLREAAAAKPPDIGAILRLQSEILWFEPDAYATRASIDQAVKLAQAMRSAGANVTPEENVTAAKEALKKAQERKNADDAARAQKWLDRATADRGCARISPTGAGRARGARHADRPGGQEGARGATRQAARSGRGSRAEVPPGRHPGRDRRHPGGAREPRADTDGAAGARQRSGGLQLRDDARARQRHERRRREGQARLQVRRAHPAGVVPRWARLDRLPRRRRDARGVHPEPLERRREGRQQADDDGHADQVRAREEAGGQHRRRTRSRRAGVHPAGLRHRHDRLGAGRRRQAVRQQRHGAGLQGPGDQRAAGGQARGGGQGGRQGHRQGLRRRGRAPGHDGASQREGDAARPARRSRTRPASTAARWRSSRRRPTRSRCAWSR